MVFDLVLIFQKGVLCLAKKGVVQVNRAVGIDAIENQIYFRVLR